MLILHPSSRCDVCLDAYTWQTIAQTPHAIPCGHIFCRPCLFALSPLICPLCRKKFDPSKAKKLHVDRPDTVDENRENDLLQRLAISAEAPEDQLQELLNEVDVWLESRADDTCLVLRQARATLTKYIELKKSGPTLEDALADIHTRYRDMTLAYDAEQSKLKGDNVALIRANEVLKTELKELRAVSEKYSYWKNPLPPPPQPVSTEYVPSFAQAIASHDRVRFELPPSPAGSPYAQSSFEVEGRKRHKGKAKSADHRLISPPIQTLHPLPTQQAKMDPSEETPALISHFDRHSPPSRHRPPTPAPSKGLKLHFENTNQPLDAFELTHTYLREYAQGLVDGQLMAGKTASFRSSTTQQPRASTSRSYSDVSLHDSSESIDARSIRSTRSAQVRGTQHVSGPSPADTYPGPTHQRQNTASSWDTSVESSSTGSTRSRSRSIPRSNQISHPDLAELLSNNAPSVPPPPRRPVGSLPTSPPDPNPNPIPQSSHGQQQLESSIQSNLTRPISPAPSMVSKASTWGTFVSTATNFTTYSLLGLQDFREGSYPRSAALDGMNTWPLADSPVNNNTAVHVRNSNRIDPRRSSQYSFTSWHGSAASSSPAQDQFSSSNSYHLHFEGENENAVRRDDELLNPSYSRDSTSRRPRPMEPERMGRGRNQPLPALSPSSFSHGSEAIINEADDRSDSTFMSFGNALGLELLTGPPAISAPTPVVPHRTFLRSFSDEA